MKRKQICTLLLALILTVFPLTVFADSLPPVVDKADLLTEKEELRLTEEAEQIRREYGMDAVILTVPSLEGESAKTYAQDYYDSNGYGVGDELSGCLFLLAMEEREWYIVTSGEAIYALTDYALLQQEELVLPYLRQGDYYGAFDQWLESVAVYYDAFQQGEPIDGIVADEDRYEGHEDIVYYEKEPSVNWFLSLAVGLAAGGITVGILRAMMNTRRSNNSAVEYMKEGSYDLRVHKDIFLYSQVSKTRRETNSASGSRGGGSSISRGSSGRSHGGRGGKF